MSDDRQPSLFPDPRIRRGAPGYVHEAAPAIPERNNQETFLLGVLAHGPATSKDLVGAVRDRFGQVPLATVNQVGARLIGLFERGAAAPIRQNGICTFGLCVRHDPALGYRHRPTDECSTHGALLVRNRAAVWVVCNGRSGSVE